jgi:hypothetical protein
MNDRDQFGQGNLTPEGFRAKQATRERTLELLRQSNHYIPDDHGDGGFLHGDYLDLCGREDETLKLLLATDTLRPGLGRYIGCNLDQKVLDHNAGHFKEATEAGMAVWVQDKWANVTTDLARFPNLRVISFDGFNAVGNRNLARIRRDSLNLAAATYRRNGGVLLVLNFCLRGTSKKEVEDHLREMQAWKEALCPGNRTQPEHRVYQSKKARMLNLWLPLGF